MNAFVNHDMSFPVDIKTIGKLFMGGIWSIVISKSSMSFFVLDVDGETVGIPVLEHPPSHFFIELTSFVDADLIQRIEVF